MKPAVQRKIVEKKNIIKQAPLKGKAVRSSSVIRSKINKTEPKHHKEDEFNWNIEINPWNAGDVDYS